MNSKEEAIKKAYGYEFEGSKEYIDENGWLLYDNETELKQIAFHPEFDYCKNIVTQNHYIRPKSIKGIENNNEWISLNSQTDIADRYCDCFFIVNNEILVGEIYDYDFYQGQQLFDFECITHYQPIILPKKPLF